MERVLAEGGMGVVVAATHLQLDRPVALKFLRADVSSNLEALARFTREAKAAAQLKSEYVAHVLDVGVTDDGTPYMVMEYLEGLSLYHVLQTQGALAIASATEYAIQACEGLAEAHARGIVHRDIKPDNLFLVERSPGWRSIKILDFGISKLALSDAQNIATGVIMGSPCYMSPEQLRSTATVDHRTDIWSLGATLYELLTSRSAFDSSLTLPELVATILHKPAPSLRGLRAEIPDELASVVDRCLAKDREARFGSASELARALLKFAPERARSSVERASSMAPAFPVSRRPAGSDGMAPSQMQGLATESEVHRVDLLLGALPTGVTTNSGLGGPSVTPTPLSMMTSPPPAGAEEATPQVWKKRRLAIATWGAGALLILALAASLRRKPQATEATAIVTPPPSVAPSIDTPPDTIDLLVRVTPSAAQITIDGVPVSGNPFHARYPKDRAIHQIRATASGFDAKWEDVPLAHDVIVDMSLDRRSGSPAARAAPPTAPGRAAGPAAPPSRAVAPLPPRAAKRVATQPAAASAAALREAAAPSFGEVNPAGGRPPLRPIDTRNPYGTP